MADQAETFGGSESELKEIPVSFTSRPLAGGRGQEGGFSCLGIRLSWARAGWVLPGWDMELRRSRSASLRCWGRSHPPGPAAAPSAQGVEGWGQAGRDRNPKGQPTSCAEDGGGDLTG